MTYLAVFDWNGTLFDDTPAVLEATNACLRSFGHPGIDLPTLQETFTFPLIHFYEKVGIPADDYLKHADSNEDPFLEAYEKASADCSLMEGAGALLDWLHEKDVHCMVLSNHLQPCLTADTERLGIARYMKRVSGNDHKATMARGMSKQIRLEAYLKEHGLTLDKAFIIGDSHEEPELARHFGMLGISMAGGMLSPSRLEKYKKDHIVHRLDEVRPILENHWKI
jgi:phosphoglycolate phosphatase